MVDLGGIQLHREHRREMLDHIRSCLPEEACGLLGGVGLEVQLVIPVENVLHSPVRYRMEPEAQVRELLSLEAKGLDLVGIYHSHPLGPSGFSVTDLSEAAYLEAAYLVWSPSGEGWDCRAFRISFENEIREVQVTVTTDEGTRG
jgi:proteasome lid subunit RPN8/RPN11